MNIILNQDTINIEDFYYGNKIENNIMHNSYFYNIYYSNNLLHINSVLIRLSLKNATTYDYFNKFKCSFKRSDNLNTIYFLCNLETQLLNMFDNTTISCYNLYDQIINEEIKINNTRNKNINSSILGKKQDIDVYLKISGVWETNDEKGLIFKFIF